MPYEQHEFFTIPETQDAFIWRYMSIAKFLALLNDNALYFSRGDKLAEMDPFEGSYTSVNTSIFETTWDMETPKVWEQRNIHSEEELNRALEAKRSLFQHLAYQKEQLFINCWHLSVDESHAMWKIYSGQQDSVCVQSTFGRLVESLADVEDEVFIGKVNYLDYDKELIREGMVFAPFMAKRRSFFYEQELRAIVWKPNDVEYIYLNRDGSPATAENYQQSRITNKYPNRYGLNVPIDLTKLINRVILSPSSTSWFLNLVHSIIEKFGYNFEIKISKLAEQPYYEV